MPSPQDECKQRAVIVLKQALAVANLIPNKGGSLAATAAAYAGYFAQIAVCSRLPRNTQTTIEGGSSAPSDEYLLVLSDKEGQPYAIRRLQLDQYRITGDEKQFFERLVAVDPSGDEAFTIIGTFPEASLANGPR